MTLQQSFTSRSRRKYRGAITLWLILLMPVLVILLLFVADIGQIWVARVELENAMEAASLAAVKEWGDKGGGSTWKPRKVGVMFAAANSVHGESVRIQPNHNDHRRNGNASCEGDLIFGAITSRHRPWVFDANVTPGCEFGEILVDASGEGNLGHDNAWGVSFRPLSGFPDHDKLFIRRMTIDLDPDDEDAAHFEESFILSDNEPKPAVRDRRQNSQPDNFGWYNTPPLRSSVGRPTRQIPFVFAKPARCNGKPRMLVIEFQGCESDAGFSPGDRFRFGAKVRVRNKHGQQFRAADGDDIGKLGAKVTVWMQWAGKDLPPIEGRMSDSGGRRRDCLDGDFVVDSIGYRHLVVHPDRILDLPCPPESSSHEPKNGQSRLLLGHGFRPYAVRAQATVSVSSLSCLFGDGIFGPYEVSACATAMYECRSNRPRLIRVRPENFKCR